MHRFIETLPDYRRYEIVADGISPRGVPGYGKGLVGVDSDEHDPSAHITEDDDVRIAMNEKRLRKLEAIRAAAIAPELWPVIDYSDLVICWGSTYWIVREAIQKLNRPNVSMLHFSQVYPLHTGTIEYLRRAKRIILVEGNATGQFGNLIKLQTDIEPHDRILKYNGLPFSVEEVIMKLREIAGEGS
jgi:2-oxoglutarate ferredoxin oxidoreductase subunit alpha